VTEPAWTISEAAGHLDPPISRRTLAQLLTDVRPAGTRKGRRGAPAATYAVADIMDVHRDWVDSQGG
jgi:hypothetical protein